MLDALIVHLFVYVQYTKVGISCIAPLVYNDCIKQCTFHRIDRLERGGRKSNLVIYHFVACLGSSTSEPGLIFRRLLKKVSSSNPWVRSLCYHGPIDAHKNCVFQLRHCILNPAPFYPAKCWEEWSPQNTGKGRAQLSFISIPHQLAITYSIALWLSLHTKCS